jgi:hypothetical protein
MARVLRVGVPIRVAAAVAVLLCCGPAKAVAAGSASSPPLLPASVGASATGQPMPAGFVGISAEYRAISQYNGGDRGAVNPVLVALVRALAPGQAPVLRIGGDSTDWTWWPIHGTRRRPGISYTLGRRWLRTTRALASALGAKLIMGVNLAAGRPALAAAEARAFLQGIGRRFVSAFEIGNEPDLYGVFPWYRTSRGRVVMARSRRYGLPRFTAEYSRWSRALPTLPVAGPSFASLPWMAGVGRFLSSERSVRIVTIHRYPLHNSTTDSADPTYPSIANLLSDAASSGIAQEVRPYAALAHGRHLSFRVDEMNSVSGRGHAGVSDTFAAALWMLDTLFNMAAAGVDGVNVHTLSGAAYAPFSFTHLGGAWQASVRPEYYGMLVFAQADPPGARLLPVSVAPGPVKVWATACPDGRTRVVLINKDPTTPVTVALGLPGARSPATLERLEAPSITATAGVTFGGRSFGSQTATGTLAGSPVSESVPRSAGSYDVDLPPAGAALLVK